MMKKPIEVQVDPKADCSFLMYFPNQEDRCAVRYHLAKRNLVEDACNERYCPLRDGGKVMVTLKEKP